MFVYYRSIELERGACVPLRRSGEGGGETRGWEMKMGVSP